MLRVANFAGIMKIATIFIKTTYKNLKKLEKIRSYILKCYLFLHFLIEQKLLISGEIMLMLVELKECDI